MSTKGQRTRKEIVEAAKTLFYHKGYTNTSFSDIVDKTNIRRGNINHYFKTKNDILEAVIDQRIAEYKSLFSEWEMRYYDPKDRLRCFVQMVASNSSNLIRYGCPIGTLNAELGKDACDFQNNARSLFDVFINWLAQQFKQINKPRQAQARALHLLSRTEGISVLAHVYNDPDLITVEVKMLQKWIDEL